MSEAELYSAFHAALGGANSILFDYISLMFAFLIMSYLAAHRLPTFLASIVIALFSLVSGLLIFQLFLYRNDAGAIASYLFEQKASGNFDLSWYGTNPTWAATTNLYLMIAVTAGGFLTCIVFFLFQRSSANVDP